MGTTGTGTNMGLLGKIKSSFEVAEKTSFVDTEPRKLVLIEVADTASCPSCGCCEWWITHGDIDPKCFHCQPWPSASLVAQHFFFDDHGNRWLVAQCNGCEEWTKQ